MDDTMQDELVAGQELDALIAWKIFGWKWWRCAANGKRSLFQPEANMEWFGVPADMTEEAANSPFVPPYSTDISAAWQVVEKLKGVSIARRADGSWTCWHWDKVHRHGVGDTAPLAICRAALESFEAT